MEVFFLNLCIYKFLSVEHFIKITLMSNKKKINRFIQMHILGKDVCKKVGSMRYKTQNKTAKIVFPVFSLTLHITGRFKIAFISFNMAIFHFFNIKMFRSDLRPLLQVNLKDIKYEI